MKIVVNTRLLIKGKLEGIGWFTRETLCRITQKHPEHQFVFLFDRSYAPEFIFSSNITPVIIRPEARHPLLYYIWFEYSIRRYFSGASLFLSPDGLMPQSAGIPMLPVIHDINFVHYPGKLPLLTGWYYNYFFPRFARAAARIATVSEFSKKDIATSFSINPEIIDVVYNGSNSFYQPLNPIEIIATKQRYTRGCDYFIYVGMFNPRKNIARLLLAFDAFKISTSSDVKLVLVGEKMFGTSDMEKVYKRIKHKTDVIFAGRKNPEELKFLIGSALALTYVSYFEGFGIPLLEAMYADVPVICSNNTSLPEVAGDAGLLVDPFSVDSIASAMKAVYGDIILRNSLIEKGRLQRLKFSWDASAALLWNSIEKCLI